MHELLIITFFVVSPNLPNNNKDAIIQQSPVQMQPHQRVTVSSQLPQANHNQGRPVNHQLKVQMNTPTQSAFVIPWHSIVPLLTASSGPTSPPISQLSPPLSAPPIATVTSQMPDVQDEETDIEPMSVPTEEDDDVFETDPTDSSIDCNNSKRRSQSLSSLHSSNKESNKVRYK